MTDTTVQKSAQASTCCGGPPVTLVFTLLGLAAWGLTRQMQHLAADLPSYRVNIKANIADVGCGGRGGTVEQLQEPCSDRRSPAERAV